MIRAPENLPWPMLYFMANDYYDDEGKWAPGQESHRGVDGLQLSTKRDPDALECHQMIVNKSHFGPLNYFAEVGHAEESQTVYL